MWRGYGRLHIGTVGAAVDREWVGTILASWVRVVEHETVSTKLQGGGAVLAGPVLVTGLVVAEVAERVRTAIGLTRAGGDRGGRGLGPARGLHAGLLALLLVST